MNESSVWLCGPVFYWDTMSTWLLAKAKERFTWSLGRSLIYQEEASIYQIEKIIAQKSLLNENLRLIF